MHWLGRALLLLSFSAAVTLGILETAYAQAVYGAIQGTITAKNRAPVRGAKVFIISEEKGTSVVTTTNRSGYFQVGHLVPDTYTVRVEAEFYEISSVPALAITADDDQKVELQMQFGA